MIQAWLAKLTFRTVSIIVLALLLVALLVWGPQACNSYFSAKKQIRVEKGQAKAGIDSGEMAVGKAGENAAKADEIDAVVKDGTNEIEQAPVGNRNDASLRASCRMRTYRDSERCAALRKADSEKLEGRNTAR